MATSITNTSISTDTINVDNGVLYVDNNNNRVGIGTTTPNTSLHISAGSSVGSLTNAFEITDSGYTNIQMLSGGADGEIKIGAAGQLRGSYKAQYAGTGGAYNFNIGTNSTNAITIDTNQYVGIGITTPAQLLHVQAGSSGNGVIRLGGGAGLEISHDNAGNTLQRIDSLYRTTSNNTNLQLRTGILTFHTGTSSTERMRIDSNGQVTTPYQPHIFGTPHTGTEASSGQATLFRVKTSRGLSFSNNRITVPAAGVYMITYQTICASNTGRYDTQVKVNGVDITNGLNEANGDGYHQRTHSFCMYLNVNDYITFHNARYYSNGSNFDAWTTASVTLLG